MLKQLNKQPKRLFAKRPMPINPFVMPGLDKGKQLETFLEQYFKLLPGSIRQKTRIREILMPRQIMFWLLHKNSLSQNKKHQWSTIGRRYGFSHATVIHAIKVIENDMHNRVFKKMVFDIQVEYYGKVKFINKTEV